MPHFARDGALLLINIGAPCGVYEQSAKSPPGTLGICHYTGSSGVFICMCSGCRVNEKTLFFFFFESDTLKTSLTCSHFIQVIPRPFCL